MNNRIRFKTKNSFVAQFLAVAPWTHISIAHFRDKDRKKQKLNKGGETVVTIYFPDIDSLITGKAICSKSDIFSKEIGRTLAIQRIIEIYKKKVMNKNLQQVSN